MEDTDSTTIYLSLKRDFSEIEEDILFIENSDFIQNAYKKLHTEHQMNNISDHLTNQKIGDISDVKNTTNMNIQKPFKEDTKIISDTTPIEKNSNEEKKQNPFIFSLNQKPKNDSIATNQETGYQNMKSDSQDKVFVLQKVNLQNIINDTRKDFINKKIAENRRKFMLLEQNTSEITETKGNSSIFNLNLKSNKINESQQKSIIATTDQSSHVIYNVVKVDKDKVNAQNYNTIVLDNTEVLNEVAQYIYEDDLYLNISDRESSDNDKESIDSNHEIHENNDYPNTPSSESVDNNEPGKKRNKKNDDFNCFVDSDCSFSHDSDDSDEIPDYAYLHKKKAKKVNTVCLQEEEYKENSNVLNRIKKYENYKENSMKIEKGLCLSGNADKEVFLMTVDPREMEANTKFNDKLPNNRMDIE